jgi:hypothetical protein
VSAVKRMPTWGRAAARQLGAEATRALRSTPKRGPQRCVVLGHAGAKASGPGVERFHGCSCRVSVAEVGEKHLLVASSTVG